MKLKDYLLIAGILIADQLSKICISHSLKLHESISIIKGFFSITCAHNTGAAFSILQGQQWLLSLMAVICVGCIFMYLTKGKVTPLEKTGFLMVAGGAIGNLIDRLLYDYVIDFLDFIIFGYDFPVFNIADSFITVGVIIILADYFIIHSDRKAGEQ